MISPRTICEFEFRSARYSDLHFSSSVLFRAAVTVDCNLQRVTHRRQIEMQNYKQSMNEVVSKLITILVRLHYMCYFCNKTEGGNFDQKFEQIIEIITFSDNTVCKSHSNWNQQLISMEDKRKARLNFGVESIQRWCFNDRIYTHYLYFSHTCCYPFTPSECLIGAPLNIPRNSYQCITFPMAISASTFAFQNSTWKLPIWYCYGNTIKL